MSVTVKRNYRDYEIHRDENYSFRVKHIHDIICCKIKDTTDGKIYPYGGLVYNYTTDNIVHIQSIVGDDHITSSDVIDVDNIKKIETPFNYLIYLKERNYL